MFSVVLSHNLLTNYPVTSSFAVDIRIRLEFLWWWCCPPILIHSLVPLGQVFFLFQTHGPHPCDHSFLIQECPDLALCPLGSLCSCPKRASILLCWFYHHTDKTQFLHSHVSKAWKHDNKDKNKSSGHPEDPVHSRQPCNVHYLNQQKDFIFEIKEVCVSSYASWRLPILCIHSRSSLWMSPTDLHFALSVHKLEENSSEWDRENMKTRKPMT